MEEPAITCCHLCWEKGITSPLISGRRKNATVHCYKQTHRWKTQKDYQNSLEKYWKEKA